MNVTDWATALMQSLNDSLAVLVNFLPKLFGAAILLVLGYLLGRTIAAVLSRLLRLVGLDRFVGQTTVRGLLERFGVTRPISDILGTIAFWIVFLLFLISATEILGLQILSGALTSLAYYIPKIGIAVLIVILGLLAANFIREVITIACNTAGIAQSTLIAQAFYVASVFLIVVTAINQLGIDTTLLNTALLLLMGGVIAGAALSFGLGARHAVSNLIAAHYLQPVLRVGQQVRVGGLRGSVVELTPMAVILETEEGRVVLPAAEFAQTRATLDQ